MPITCYLFDSVINLSLFLFIPSSSSTFLQRQSSNMLVTLMSIISLLSGSAIAQCPDYVDYSSVKHYPYSGGVRNLSYQRPDPACRTFNLSLLENQVILDVMHATPDLDLFRLFLNSKYHLSSLNPGAYSSQPTQTPSIRPSVGRATLPTLLTRSLPLSLLEILMPCG